MFRIPPQLRAAAQSFGFDVATLPFALGIISEASDFPLLGSDHDHKVKVYLDTKDWIALARARLGKAGSEKDRPIYEDLRVRAAAGEILVPLTSSLYQEISKIGLLRQRTHLAEVIAEISGFATFTSMKNVVCHQMRAALASRQGLPLPAPLKTLGIGVSFAHGDTRRLTIRRTDGQAIDISPELVHELTTCGRALTEMMFLIGPTPEEIPQLRAGGYRPELVLANHAKRVAHEQQFADMLAADPRMRAKLERIVQARHIAWELIDFIEVIAPEYGMTLETFIAQGADWMVAFLEDVPSAAVTTTLMERNFRNSYKTWTGNDLYDADAMAVAIPYCDVVMADKHVTAQLATSGAVTRCGTLLLSKLTDLHQRLPALIANKQPPQSTRSQQIRDDGQAPAANGP
ncbi:hypothetical protein AQJ91_18310 [Streptomyces dysideae]|uniref:Uncharacterized protein n=1 Tax=Streptomyces dysideae TaxID=909626 RepID=A0A117S0E8_9ACTN|nr:hypothetical protein AQJ91_18310 [Streptomyces dysideae]